MIQFQWNLDTTFFYFELCDLVLSVEAEDLWIWVVSGKTEIFRELTIKQQLLRYCKSSHKILAFGQMHCNVLTCVCDNTATRNFLELSCFTLLRSRKRVQLFFLLNNFESIKNNITKQRFLDFKFSKKIISQVTIFSSLKKKKKRHRERQLETMNLNHFKYQSDHLKRTASWGRDRWG